VYFPGLKVAVQVEFARGDAVSVVSSQSPRPWLDQAAEATEVQWVGKRRVNGRKCAVLEFAPPSGSREDGLSTVSPALGARFADVPLIGDWKRTRLYLDDATGLPIRGEALKDNAAVLFSWTAANPQVDTGLTAQDFEFQPPEGVRVVKRTYDPAHPERLFLPPGKGRSLLRRLGDALEEGARDYLEGDAGEPTP
jgi:hypothetical protein